MLALQSCCWGWKGVAPDDIFRLTSCGLSPGQENLWVQEFTEVLTFSQVAEWGKMFLQKWKLSLFHTKVRYCWASQMCSWTSHFYLSSPVCRILPTLSVVESELSTPKCSCQVRIIRSPWVSLIAADKGVVFQKECVPSGLVRWVMSLKLQRMLGRGSFSLWNSNQQNKLSQWPQLKRVMQVVGLQRYKFFSRCGSSQLIISPLTPMRPVPSVQCTSSYYIYRDRSSNKNTLNWSKGSIPWQLPKCYLLKAAAPCSLRNR